MMFISYLLVFVVFFVNYSYCAQQTLYEYYVGDEIKSGLEANTEQFMLNGKKIVIFSGSLHYFRLPKEYWKDRLLKYKAAGLNAIQLYNPWNLHEETPGNFDFETGFLNLADFLTAIQETDMFAIVRLGPYICAEWEMGGYPAWLLRDPNLRLRSNYKPYLELVGKYFAKLLPIINKFQFTKGGPIIALQFENEYGGVRNQNDFEYLSFLKNTIQNSGFRELLFTSDPGGTAEKNPIKKLPGVLETANFNDNSLAILTELRKNQPNKPLYVSEFWPGWFDNWGDKTHHTMTIQHFEKEVTDILFKANASMNFYMFFGGTNFAFTNGGRVVTSYDYNAPLSESGNYTDKYWKAKDLFAKLTKERNLPNIHIPDPPKVSLAAKYGTIKMKDYLSLEDILSQMKPIISDKPKQMELLNIGPNYGQNFGFILYRTSTNKFGQLKLSGGVSDRGVVLIDQNEVTVVQTNKNFTFETNNTMFSNSSNHVLDVLVENMGRVNGGDEMNHARKGLNGDVITDEQIKSNYSIYPLEFKQKFVEKLKTMSGKSFKNVKSPALYRTQLDINGSPSDTFLRLDNWVKGIVFVNGFNIGRYYNIGPQKTLYIPAPLLKSGKNDIFVFELHSASNTIEFVDEPDLGHP